MPEEQNGLASQEPPCIHLDENGKHPWTVWGYNHRQGYKFWIPKCHHCGYIDTDGILKEIKEKGLLSPPATLVPLDENFSKLVNELDLMLETNNVFHLLPFHFSKDYVRWLIAHYGQPRDEK